MTDRAQNRHPVGALAAAVALTGGAGAAWAQPGPIPLRPPRIEVPPAVHLEGGDDTPARPTLRQHVALERGKQLLSAPSWQDRVRGIERLASDGSDEAVDALVEAMAEGSAVHAHPRTRLVAVRALAPHAKKDAVRRVLVAALTGGDADEPDGPIEGLARATAAMALARAGTSRTLTPLLTAIIARDPVAPLCEQALLAYPPRSLAPLVRGFKRGISPEIVDLLGRLRDPRAIGVLRQLLNRPPELRHAAGLALARLGDESAADHARRWLAAAGDDTRARLAALRVLVELDAPDAPALLARMLGDAGTRAQALALAERSLSPALVPTLVAVVKAPVSHAERARAVTMLSLMGGEEAATALVELLGEPELASAAALGLGQIPDPAAGRALARALAAAAAGAPRRLVVRAALVRKLRWDETVDGLAAALANMASSADAADQAVAAFGGALMGTRSLVELARTDKPHLLHAAARAALALGPEARAALAPALDAPRDASVRVAASVALSSPSDAVSTGELAAWAEAGGPEAPLSAMRLAQRDSQPFRSRLERLLDGSDPRIRQHVALGLGHSPEPSAASLLADAYRFEPEADVRRAIVRALSLRREAPRRPVLELARSLDPDAGVRALAESALSGRRLDEPALGGRQVAWLSLRPNRSDARDAVRSRPALLVRGDAPAIGVVTDPDGVLLVPGLSDTRAISVQLAPWPSPDKP